MDETTFQYLKASGFVISFAMIYSAQALLPYRFGRRLGTPSWRQNVPLALFNTIALSLLCGAVSSAHFAPPVPAIRSGPACPISRRPDP